MSFLRSILFFGFTALVLGVYAQDTKYTASAPASVQVGQQFQYNIHGNQQASTVSPALSDFDVLRGPIPQIAHSSSWVNGKMTSTTDVTYVYLLRARKEGEFTIAPATLKIKKEEFKTNEVRINVVSGTSSSNAAASNPNGQTVSSGGTSTSAQSSDDKPVFLRVQPSKKDVFVGEQFVSELKVYTSVNTRPTAGVKEVPYEGFYKHSLDADQNSLRENINGKLHITQVLQRHVLIPQKAGKIVIEPFGSEWTIPQQVQQQRSGSIFDDFYNDPFFNRVREVPEIIRTKAVTINVKPLPDGAPEGFTGGVGDLDFSAKLSTDHAVVNDALSLKLTITGTGNISLIGTPEIDFPPDHDVYETTKSSKISTAGNKVSGTITFEYPIVVRHAGKYRIAPVKFAWFDPRVKEYKTITTEEFFFTVEKGEEGEEGGQVYIPGLHGEEVADLATDILDISRKIPGFIEIGKSPMNHKFYWIAYVMLLTSFIGLLIILPVYFRQKADVKLTRNRKANKMARTRLKLADKARKTNETERFFEETEKAIWGYLSDKLDIEKSTLSRDTVASVLPEVAIGEELQNELVRIIDECEFSRYAPSDQKSDMDTLFNDAISLIHKLEQQIQSR